MRSSDFNPELHPRDLIGRFSHVASGDKSGKKAAITRHAPMTFKPKRYTPHSKAPRRQTADDTSDYNFTGSKETQYHHRQGRWRKESDFDIDEMYRRAREGGDVQTSRSSAGGDKSLRAHLEAKIAADKKKAAAQRKPSQKVSDILVGGRVLDASELPRHTPTPEQQAAQAEARKYVNMDLKWPTAADLPRMMDREAKQGFITNQFHGILGRKGLDTSRDNTASLDDIMAHTGLPEERRADIKYVLTELEARGVVFAKGGHGDERGYWINKAVGSARSGGGRGRPGKRR